MQARRAQPAPGRRPDGPRGLGRQDARRLVAAILSSIYPGLGQAYNRQARLVLLFALPITLLTLLGTGLVLSQPRQVLFARLLIPDVLLALLMVNLMILAWRLTAAVQAFLDGRHPGRVSPPAALGLVLVLGLAAAPQGYLGYLGYGVYQTANAIFYGGPDEGHSGPTTPAETLAPGETMAPTPSPAPSPDWLVGGRINVLLMGIDSRPSRRHALADTLIVVSIDPKGKTVSMVSIPRDMVDVPIGNGDIYGPKINSLIGYADANPKQFPQGGTRALEDALGALLGIQIHYYARVDLIGFINMVDAVGGIDVDVKKPLNGAGYNDFGVRNFSVGVGIHHFDGKEALAYARIRKAAGESDFTRAARQQEVLVALRDAAVKRGLLDLGRLQALLEATREAIRTDFPPEHLPDLAALAAEIDASRTVSAVIKSPLVHSGKAGDPRGSIQVPVYDKILEMARGLFTEPGVPPIPWPSPKPTPVPSPTATPTLP